MLKNVEGLYTTIFIKKKEIGKLALNNGENCELLVGYLKNLLYLKQPISELNFHDSIPSENSKSKNLEIS